MGGGCRRSPAGGRKSLHDRWRKDAAGATLFLAVQITAWCWAMGRWFEPSCSMLAGLGGPVASRSESWAARAEAKLRRRDHRSHGNETSCHASSRRDGRGSYKYCSTNPSLHAETQLFGGVSLPSEGYRIFP